MPKYITLIRFTEQGTKQIKQSTARARAFAEAGAKVGVTVEAYWTTGSYDGVLVLSADSFLFRSFPTTTMSTYEICVGGCA